MTADLAIKDWFIIVSGSCFFFFVRKIILKFQSKWMCPRLIPDDSDINQINWFISLKRHGFSLHHLSRSFFILKSIYTQTTSGLESVIGQDLTQKKESETKTATAGKPPRLTRQFPQNRSYSLFPKCRRTLLETWQINVTYLSSP